MKKELLLKYLLEDFVKKNEPINKTLDVKVNLTGVVFSIQRGLN